MTLSTLLNGMWDSMALCVRLFIVTLKEGASFLCVIEFLDANPCSLIRGYAKK